MYKKAFLLYLKRN